MCKVSVIIPVYNVEAYLRDCLDSAVNQTLKEVEIICIDDGSTDSSVRIVTEYMERHSNIKLIRKENGGPSAARNAGLDVAGGEYICFVDSDDSIAGRALECLYEKARQEQLDILYFNTEVVFENDQIREKHMNQTGFYARPGDYSGVCTGQTMFARMRKDNKFLPVVWIQLYRRAFLEEAGIRFYEGILHEDNLFAFQCAMLARRVNYLCEQFYRYRMRENSIMTGAKSVGHLEGHLVSYCEAAGLLRKVPLQEDAAGYVRGYLHHKLFRTIREAWQQLPEEEKQKPLRHSGIGEEQLLELCKKLLEQEEQCNRLQAHNTMLTKKLNEAERKLAEASRRRGPAAYIKAFFRTVADRGPGYALRKAWAKLTGSSRR